MPVPGKQTTLLEYRPQISGLPSPFRSGYAIVLYLSGTFHLPLSLHIGPAICSVLPNLNPVPVPGKQTTLLEYRPQISGLPSPFRSGYAIVLYLSGTFHLPLSLHIGPAICSVAPNLNPRPPPV